MTVVLDPGGQCIEPENAVASVDVGWVIGIGAHVVEATEEPQQEQLRSQSQLVARQRGALQVASDK